jgi:hypothetical protein
MLKQIHASGYRSVRELALNLQPINVLTGPNGGKSNLYNSLVLIGRRIAAFCLAASLLTAPQLSAQSITAMADEQPAFEVTSVKRDTTDAMVELGGPDISRFVARNVTAKDLIQFSYDLRDFQFFGGPPWITTEKFDADGKVEGRKSLRLLPKC